MGGEDERVAGVEGMPSLAVEQTAHLKESGRALRSLVLCWWLLAMESSRQIESSSTLFGRCSVQHIYQLSFSRLECSGVGQSFILRKRPDVKLLGISKGVGVNLISQFTWQS